jgi:hypothetical protein
MHAVGVCIFVYVAAEHPLERAAEGGLRLKKLKPREHKKLIDGENVYLALGGCACALTLDGADEEDRAERRTLLDQFEAFLAAATVEGPLDALVTDGSRTPPRELALSVAGFRDFDFDSAWEAPTLLRVRSG